MNASRKGYFLLGLFYLIAHGGILLIPNAIYWDDWLLYRVDSNVILDTFKQVGSMFNIFGHIHVVLLAIGPWIYKIFTFLLMFFSGLMLNIVLKRYSGITTESRLFIVLLFLIFPLNIARVALINFPYTLSYFLFFTAWALMDKNRIVALVLFFLSFNTNSLLLFFALPMLDLFYRGGAFRSPKNFFLIISRKLDFILIPLIYWYIKTVYYVPYGLYNGYNSSQAFSFSKLSNSYHAQWTDFYNNFIYQGGYLAGTGTYLILSLSTLCAIILNSKYNKNETNNLFSNISLVLIGVLAFVFASIPYGLLGHNASFLDWTSRHQLLLPLGLSFIVVGFFGLLGNRTRIFIFSFVAALSIVVNVKNYIDLYTDWEKQKQLVALFKVEPRLKNAGLIGFEDSAASFNAIGRVYRDYEWTGLLKLAFGDELRYGTNRSAFESIRKMDQNNPGFTAYYNAADYKNDGVRESIFVKIINKEAEERAISIGFLPRQLKLSLIVETIDKEK